MKKSRKRTSTLRDIDIDFNQIDADLGIKSDSTTIYNFGLDGFLKSVNHQGKEIIAQ